MIEQIHITASEACDRLSSEGPEVRRTTSREPMPDCSEAQA